MTETKEKKSLVVLDVTLSEIRFKLYAKEVARMVKMAESHSVLDDETNVQAVNMASQAKKLFNELELLRKEIIKGPNGFVKTINTISKAFTGKMAVVESGLKAKISVYLNAKERAQRKAEAEERERARKKQERFDAEAEEKGIEPVKVPDPVVPAKLGPTRAAEGSASLRKVRVWKEVDFSKVPDEYKMLDTGKITRAVKSGENRISGLLIYEESHTVLGKGA